MEFWEKTSEYSKNIHKIRLHFGNVRQDPLIRPLKWPVSDSGKSGIMSMGGWETISVHFYKFRGVFCKERQLTGN